MGRMEKQWPRLAFAHFALLALVLAVQNVMTLVGAKAVDPFPGDLAAMMGSIDIEIAMPCSWGYFFWHSLPPSRGKLLEFPEGLGLRMLDGLKFNLLPAGCSPPDLLLDDVGRVKACGWKDIHLMATVMRMAWTKGFHDLCAFSLTRYMQL